MSVEHIPQKQPREQGDFFKKGDRVYVIPPGSNKPNLDDWFVAGFEIIDNEEWVKVMNEEGDLDYYKEDDLKKLQAELVSKKLSKR